MHYSFIRVHSCTEPYELLNEARMTDMWPGLWRSPRGTPITYISKERSLIFQLQVEIYDDANPTQRVETSVKITVQRNVNAPQFGQENYRANVVENYPIGASVVTVQARDNDNVRITVTSIVAILYKR